MAAPAPLTDAEWTGLSPLFPNLERGDTLRTGPENKIYNCIRFALDTTGPWVDPPPQQADFETLCEFFYPNIPRYYGNECCPKVHGAGWVTCDRNEGTVDGYLGLVNNLPEMTHASRYTTAWESKLGEYIRVQHARTQLTSQPLPGSAYGDIVVSFKRPVTSIAASSVVAVQASAPESTSAESVASDSVKIDAVVSVLDTAFSTLADDFETAYAAWKATWFSKQMLAKERYLF
jgi:hypothetical protein